MAITHRIAEEVLGCTSVAFDEHALKRMRERKVSEDDVLEVLRTPDETGLRADPNRQRYRKRLGSRQVDVVFEQDPTEIVVISVIA